MKLKVGDFVLIKIPCSGIGDTADLGPHIVEIERFSPEGIYYKHYISFKDINNKSSASGWALYGDIIAEIHEKDVEALFKEGL